MIKFAGHIPDCTLNAALGGGRCGQPACGRGLTPQYQWGASIDGSGNVASANNTATNRLNGGLGYDGAGRVLSGSWGGVSSRAFTWDPEGKMLTYSDQNTSIITYSYDAFGRRVMAQQAGSTTRYWLYGASGGDHPIAEYSGAWQTNIEVEGTTVATVDSANHVTYLALGMLKTTKMTVNASGSPSGVATYNPYGVENASITAEYKFTNQIRDPNGIDHFWMSSYSATLGRWLTPDSAGLAAVDPSNPQSWNRYAYVLNNPASLIDPLGLTCYVANGSTSPVSEQDCIDSGNTWSVMVDGGLEVEASGGSVPYYIAVLQADGSSQWQLDGSNPVPGGGDGGGGTNSTSGMTMQQPVQPPQGKLPVNAHHEPCPPLAHDPNANGLDTLFDGVGRITHPLDMMAVNSTFFIAGAAAVGAGGAAMVGGCLDPTPGEPLTCAAGIAGGAPTVSGGVYLIKQGVSFFRTETLPAIKDWGCEE